MPQEIDMEAMNSKIKVIKAAATELHQMADAFPAIARNSARILSSTKMLEINLSDIVDLETEQH
jgi:predicted N-acyltransferase